LNGILRYRVAAHESVLFSQPFEDAPGSMALFHRPRLMVALNGFDHPEAWAGLERWLKSGD
jgi:hypothetical protein